MPTVFPMALILEGRSCLVIGGGEIAAQKVSSLLACSAEVTVIAPQSCERLQAWIDAGAVQHEPRPYLPGDLEGAFLVVAATSEGEVNRAVFEEARQRRVLVNVVDRPEWCDFYYPAVLRRGGLTIGISTNGQSPALARALRDWLEVEFDEAYGQLLELFAEFRDPIRERFVQMSDRRRVWSLIHEQRETLLALLRTGQTEPAREVVRSCIS